MQPKNGTYLDNANTNMWLTTCGRDAPNDVGLPIPAPTQEPTPSPGGDNGAASGGGSTDSTLTQIFGGR